jgi:branched-chain amino acid transport system permease protein
VTTFLDVLIAGLIMGGIYALVAIGLNLQWGVTHVLNMAHGEFIMLGAFATFYLFTVVKINPLVTLVIVAPVMFIFGLGVFGTLFKYLLRRSESTQDFEITSLLAAYGLMFILSNAANLAFGSNQHTYTFLSDSVSIGGAVFGLNRLVALGIAVVLCLACYWFIAHTRMGKAIRATSQDIDRAKLMGINVNVLLALCFALGATMAALAGSLLSTMFSTTPFMGLHYLTITFIVVILGGMGNILGSLVAGFILGIVGSIVTYFEPGLNMVAFYAIFVLIVLLRPTGLFGRRA